MPQQLIVVLASLLVWRFAEWQWGVVIAVGLVGGHLWAIKQKRTIPLCVIACIQLAVLASGFIPGIWNCSIGCDDGAFYRSLGLPVLAWAIIGWVGLLLVYLRKNATLNSIIAALLIGGHLYFIYVSIRLGIQCDHCAAAHTVALLAAAWIRTPLAIPALIAGFGALHFAFHPQIVSDRGAAPDVINSTDSSSTSFRTTPQQSLISDKLFLYDTKRRFGNPQTAISLRIVHSADCAHCAEVIPGILQYVYQEALNDRLHAQIVLQTRPYDEASVDRGHLLLAAGAEGSFANALLGLLNSDGLTPADNRQRLAELMPVPALDNRIAIDSPTLSHILDADRAFIRSHLRGATPVVGIYVNDQLQRVIPAATLSTVQAALTELP